MILLDKTKFAPLAMCVMFFLAASTAYAAGDKAKGAKLAEQWCNSCHTVKTSGSSRKFDTGPRFVELAKKSGSYLVIAINKPHDFMPKFPALSPKDKTDLIAHIQSLK